MNKQIPGMMLDEKQEQFTGEEIAVFKRYIEENVVYTDNNFELLEENLTYYSSRYTSEHYFSPAEFFHVNSNMTKTDEIEKNLNLYLQAIKWHSLTVHPQDSEYVLKKEKYTNLDDFPERIVKFVQYLNCLDEKDFFILDLYIYMDGEIYQYLPKKDFLFKWKRKAKRTVEKMIEHHYYSFHHEHKLLKEGQPILFLPVFVPIRKMLFLGEYGYRSGLIEYGKVIGYISNYCSLQEQPFIQVQFFDMHQMNQLLRLDGVERSIQTIFVTK